MGIQAEQESGRRAEINFFVGKSKGSCLIRKFDFFNRVQILWYRDHGESIEYKGQYILS